jgi:hypothetical protein
MESPAAASTVETAPPLVDGTLQAMLGEVTSTTGELEGGIRMPTW